MFDCVLIALVPEIEMDFYLDQCKGFDPSKPSSERRQMNCNGIVDLVETANILKELENIESEVKTSEAGESISSEEISVEDEPPAAEDTSNDEVDNDPKDTDFPTPVKLKKRKKRQDLSEIMASADRSFLNN